MSWRIAKSLIKLRAQINEKYPGRDKSSDGSIGDTSHKARKSDHNPNRLGVVTAIDVDEDLSSGIDAMPIVRSLQASRDRRIKYIIYEGRITVPGDITKWKAYSGVNPHKHHFHISVSSDPSLYDDDKDWVLDGAVPMSVPVSHPQIKRGTKGSLVVLLQTLLNKHGKTLTVDGDFGPNVDNAVRQFQRTKGLDPDGIVGPKTWALLEGE